jgi:hypothetical protein
VREQFGEICMPLNFLCVTASEIRWLSDSTTKRKSKGESGQPFLSPLSSLKKGEVEPFMRREKVVEMQLRIQENKGVRESQMNEK